MVNIESTFSKAKAGALVKWRGWVNDIVEGGKAPPVLEVREAAELLGVANGIAELEADAKALRDLRHLEERLAATKQAMDDRTAADGDQATIRAKLAAARAEVCRLESLIGITPAQFARISELVRSIETIRRGRPRIFDPRTKRSTSKKQKRASKQKVSA